ncbi:hypothetical protein P8629_05680 [Hydrogenovibrio sp. 3SP14C1]|uniref:hypothetical protein n=1 Tax=Hydrogenovibrio sp. 3SP14C1 TaxID=3038774 RepID=UPI002417F842|nr:hypothetical protein [Hydrogenovibrio sp. 3SP14C1]MDG4812492.1 hypothetical protein [Hydrogenovibrio sp. 3SP14C1]
MQGSITEDLACCGLFYGKVLLLSEVFKGVSGLQKLKAIYLLVLIGWLFVLPVSAETDQALKGEALHVMLVKTALKYDYFNQRCRGVSASQKEAKVNRLFIEKYNLTINNFIKQFLTRDPRETEAALKKELYAEIYQFGGCQQAREKGLEDSLKKGFRELYQKTESSPWFPILE